MREGEQGNAVMYTGTQYFSYFTSLVTKMDETLGGEKGGKKMQKVRDGVT